MRKLTKDYVAGFIDGEGCFALKYRADRRYDGNGKKLYEYHYWTAEFAIVLNPTDTALLERIQAFFGVGRLSFKKTGDQARFSVQNMSDLKKVIVPFFEENELIGAKAEDFALWSKAVGLLHQHREKERIGKTKPLDKNVEQKLKVIKEQIDQIKRRGRPSK